MTTTETQVQLSARKLKKIERRKMKDEKKKKRLIAQLKAMGMSVVVENEGVADPGPTNEGSHTATKPAPSGESEVATFARTHSCKAPRMPTLPLTSCVDRL